MKIMVKNGQASRKSSVKGKLARLAKSLSVGLACCWMAFAGTPAEAAYTIGAERPAISLLNITGSNNEVNEQAASALMNTLGKLRSVSTVERQKLAQVFSEKALQDAGIVQSTFSNRSIQAIGLDYVMIGEASVVPDGYIYIAGRPHLQYTAAIHVRLVDVRNNVANVVWSTTDTSSSLDEWSTAIRECAFDCVRAMYERFPISGCIVSGQGDRYYIDLGTSSGIERGDTLTLQGNARTILHPRTGQPMVIEDGKTAELKVEEVHPDYAIVKAKGGAGARISIGSTVTKKLCKKGRILGMVGWNGKVDF